MPESNTQHLNGTLKQTVMLTAYRTLGCILLPVLPIALYIRGKKQVGYRQRMLERFGFAKCTSDKRSIVIHGASLGEITALKPIIERCIDSYPDHQIVVTSFTPAGSAKVLQLFGSKVNHTYLPFDILPCTGLFIQRIQPVLMIFMETEIWPSLIHQAYDHNIKLALINARISDKAYPKYQKQATLIAPSIRRFSRIICQSAINKERFISLGAKEEQLSVTGNLKFDSPPVSINDEIKSIHRSTEDRPIWLIASSHHDEERLLLNSFLLLKKEIPNILCIWAPRHIEQFDSVYDICQGASLKTVRRSKRQISITDEDVLLIDTIGELAQFYSLATVSTVCGSFNATGGHNPLEPLLQNSVTTFGPNMANTQEIVDLLLESKAVFQHTEISEELVAKEIKNLLTNRLLQEGFKDAGRTFLTQHRGSVTETMSVINDIF